MRFCVRVYVTRSPTWKMQLGEIFNIMNFALRTFVFCWHFFLTSYFSLWYVERNSMCWKKLQKIRLSVWRWQVVNTTQNPDQNMFSIANRSLEMIICEFLLKEIHLVERNSGCWKKCTVVERNYRSTVSTSQHTVSTVYHV